MITLFYGSEREKVLAAFATYESEKNYQLEIPRIIYGINFSMEYQTLFDPAKISDLLNSDHYSLFMNDCLDYYGKQSPNKWYGDKRESNFLLLMRRSIRRDVDFYISSEKSSDFCSEIKKYTVAKIECNRDKGHTVGNYVLLRSGEKSQIVLD